MYEKAFIPMIVTAPPEVALTTASIMAFAPFENFTNSKTPGGPFHTTVFARPITLANNYELLVLRPIHMAQKVKFMRNIDPKIRTELEK
ncbi:hypothetical protein KIN20_010848 [Parelaphostrongylus tenuis]|uniref:Uncharacterized protein n=1 Tax=Parelaphostrongylus tenuis TaxID=148309 RepID=A0AAD5M8H8_PARTN|nr:hypothetical protein KIN20_010848 [Parelaphostrongylus tenuis]